MEENKVVADQTKKETKKPNDGFKPIPTGEQSTSGDSRLPTSRQGFGQRSGGFGQNQNRRPGFKRAGFGKDKPRDDFQTKLLDLARVTRVTGGGKRMSFRATIVAGDKKGKVGIGVDKGKDVSQAIEKATRIAKKNLISVVIIEGTIPHEVEAKSGPARILLKPQKKGRGLVAGGAVRTICDWLELKTFLQKFFLDQKIS